MGTFDDMQSNAQSAMSDPAKRARIEQIAQEKGITMEEAKAHFMKNEDKQL